MTPSRNIAHELSHLREMRKSLGGEALIPVEIDLDLLYEAYPREGCFLLQENNDPQHANTFHHNQNPSFGHSHGSQSGSFFKSDKEREYAKNLMKELVQIYILQGVHGREAFKKALSETRSRLYAHRGENLPELPPAIPSPALDDWSPRGNHSSRFPESTITPRSGKTVNLPKSSLKKRPVSPAAAKVPVTTLTPSRVKDIVAAIQSTPKKTSEEEVPVRKTPGSSARIKAIGECIEATIAANTPSKRKTGKDKHEPVVESVSHDSPAGKKRKSAEQPSVKASSKKPKMVESVSPAVSARPRRKAAAVVPEPKTKGPPEVVSESESSTRKSTRNSAKATAPTVSKKRSQLDAVVEEELPTRSSRRTKKT